MIKALRDKSVQAKDTRELLCSGPCLAIGSARSRMFCLQQNASGDVGVLSGRATTVCCHLTSALSPRMQQRPATISHLANPDAPSHSDLCARQDNLSDHLIKSDYSPVHPAKHPCRPSSRRCHPFKPNECPSFLLCHVFFPLEKKKAGYQPGCRGHKRSEIKAQRALYHGIPVPLARPLADTARIPRSLPRRHPLASNLLLSSHFHTQVCSRTPRLDDYIIARHGRAPTRPRRRRRGCWRHGHVRDHGPGRHLLAPRPSVVSADGQHAAVRVRRRRHQPHRVPAKCATQR